MILTIDTTERDKIDLGLFDGKIHRCFEFETQYQSEDLLIAIDGILKNNKFKLKDLKAILVNCGPGSFTGVRVGVTVANTLGWTLNIPVVGYRDGELEKALAKISKNRPAKFSSIALPYYK